MPANRRTGENSSLSRSRAKNRVTIVVQLANLPAMSDFITNAVLLATLLLAGGCVSTNLYLATEHLESSASPKNVYVLADGSMAIECEVEIGYRSITRETRYIVVEHDWIRRRFERAGQSLKPGQMPRIYLGSDTPSRYVTTNKNRSGLAEPVPDLLVGASPPIDLHPNNQFLTEVVYKYGVVRGIIERKGLLRDDIDHSTRSAGGYALFTLGIVPAVAVDVVTSPVQLVVAIVYYASLKEQYNLQPVGL